MKGVVLVVALTVAAAAASRGQGSEDQSVLGAVKQLQGQQAQIADNEAKIESKVNDVAEAIRLARLYMSRVGGAHKFPPAK